MVGDRIYDIVREADLLIGASARKEPDFTVSADNVTRFKAILKRVTASIDRYTPGELSAYLRVSWRSCELFENEWTELLISTCKHVGKEKARTLLAGLPVPPQYL